MPDASGGVMQTPTALSRVGNDDAANTKKVTAMVRSALPSAPPGATGLLRSESL
jgi:hypothetical protein